MKLKGGNFLNWILILSAFAFILLCIIMIMLINMR